MVSIIILIKDIFSKMLWMSIHMKNMTQIEMKFLTNIKHQIDIKYHSNRNPSPRRSSGWRVSFHGCSQSPWIHRQGANSSRMACKFQLCDRGWLRPLGSLYCRCSRIFKDCPETIEEKAAAGFQWQGVWPDGHALCSCQRK